MARHLIVLVLRDGATYSGGLDLRGFVGRDARSVEPVVPIDLTEHTGSLLHDNRDQQLVTSAWMDGKGSIRTSLWKYLRKNSFHWLVVMDANLNCAT